MSNYSNYFIYDVNDGNAISFLINGKTKNSSFYNYLVRKITSQLEVRDNVYPLGPSVLTYDTKDIISPIWEDSNPFILDIIVEIDSTDSLVSFSRDYINKFGYFIETYDDEVYRNKINLYFGNDNVLKIGDNYNNLKAWIEINTSINRAYFDENKEKEIFINCFNNYFESFYNMRLYINNLKRDIVTNYNMYKEIFSTDFTNFSLYEILDYIRNNMDHKMLVKKDRVYRDYELGELDKECKFFSVTSRPECIKADMDNLNIEYENVKKITDINEYLYRGIMVFQKFIKIHPYKDGNGRTSRLLFDIILLNRGILPPILYNSNYDRVELDVHSNNYTINGIEEHIVKFLKDRIEITSKEFNNI